MQPAICLLPVVPMRSEPSHRSEMVSQLLFGEYVIIGEENGDFVAVQCAYDGYKGWVQASQLTAVPEISETTSYIGSAQAEVVINGVRKMISIGSPVYIPGQELQFDQTSVVYSVTEDAVWNSRNYVGNAVDQLQALYTPYLYTPYLWGGRSVYGIDCSGFVQQVFKLLGVPLLRDASMQAEQGEDVKTLEDAQPGDLAFFQNEKGRVMHVGIVLKDRAIVHASGRVRIDTIDQEGIWNEEAQKRTHRLHSIRRFF